VRESRRETATFRNLEIVEEIAEDDDDEDGTSDPVRTQAVSTMSATASKARCSAPRS
jgi:hypothetical protein